MVQPRTVQCCSTIIRYTVIPQMPNTKHPHVRGAVIITSSVLWCSSIQTSPEHFARIRKVDNFRSSASNVESPVEILRSWRSRGVDDWVSNPEYHPSHCRFKGTTKNKWSLFGTEQLSNPLWSISLISSHSHASQSSFQLLGSSAKPLIISPPQRLRRRIQIQRDVDVRLLMAQEISVGRHVTVSGLEPQVGWGSANRMVCHMDYLDYPAENLSLKFLGKPQKYENAIIWGFMSHFNTHPTAPWSPAACTSPAAPPAAAHAAVGPAVGRRPGRNGGNEPRI